MTAVERPDALRRSVRRRRLLAVLAAVTVAGAGGSVTSLAAWRENQVVQAGDGGGHAIGSSTFCFKESLDAGATWVDNQTSPGGQLTFTTSSSTILSPGDAVVAYVQLATCASSRGATVTLGAPALPSTNALTSVLTYGAISGLASSACTASAFTNPTTGVLAAPGSSLSAAPTAGLTLGAGSSGAMGTPVGVCFELALPATATVSAQGLTAAPIWTFGAVSS